MRRVASTSKSMTSQQKSSNPVPNFSNVKTVNFKSMPSLISFLKNENTLDSRKVGIYTLKRQITCHKAAPIVDKYTIFTYKLGKTKYEIKSCEITIYKENENKTEGYVSINSGLFRNRVFYLEDLPNEITNSINKHINQFNKEYREKFDKEINKFVKGLDL